MNNETRPQQNDTTPIEPTTSEVAPRRNNKKIVLFIVLVITLIVTGVSSFLLLGSTENKPVSDNNEVGNTSLSPTQDNGYTGIAADVLTTQTYECAPRTDNEWYRTDRTLVVDHTDPDTLYVSVEYRGIFKSTDGGNSWSQKTKGIKVYARQDDQSRGCYGEYPVIRMNPKNNQHLVIGLSSGGGGNLDPTTPNSQVGGVYQTFDGGDTWKLMITNKMNTYVTDVAFDPTDPNIIYYSTASNPASWQEADQTKLYVEKGLIYKTTDQGKTWTELPTGIGKNTSVTNLLINSKAPSTINAPTYSAVRQSADGTGTGLSTGKDSNVQQLGVLTTENTETWSTIPGSESTPFQRAFASSTNWLNQFYVPSQQALAGSPYGLYSTDGGKTLSKTTYLDHLAYDPSDPSGNTAIGYSTIGWTPSDSTFSLYKTTNGGKDWAKYGALPSEIINPNDPKTRVSNIVWSVTDKNTIYMSGHGGLVWKSIDSGNTWKKLLDYTQLAF